MTPNPELLPPQNIEAEEYVLGAMMLAPTAIDAVRPILRPDDFYRPSHATIYQACLDLHDIGVLVEPTAVVDELDQRGDLTALGGTEGKAAGAERIREIATLTPVSGSAAHHARIVRTTAQRRAEWETATDLSKAATNSGGLQRDPDLRAKLRGLLDAAELASGSQTARRVLDGGAFVLDTPPQAVSIWGFEQQIAWAQGEALMLVGPQGVGKTTVAQQLALARIGIRQHVLTWAVEPDPRPVLYLALDRPAQAARSMARMVTPADRPILEDRLRVWKGPLPFSLKDDPSALANLARAEGAGTVVIDSLKDLAPELSKEPDAFAVNQSRQHLLAANIEVLEIHHQRKATADNKIPNTIADIYGNQQLTAGTGSILIIWGQPGDPVVLLKHLKQPAEQIAPHDLIHDHVTGSTRLDALPDLLDLARQAGRTGITAKTAAEALYRTDTPDRNEVERARRRLRTLATSHKLFEIPGTVGMHSEPAKWVYDNTHTNGTEPHD